VLSLKVNSSLYDASLSVFWESSSSLGSSNSSVGAGPAADLASTALSALSLTSMNCQAGACCR
jgi:hypothetical protein